MKSSTRLSTRRVKHVTNLGLGLLALGMIADGPALAATATSNLEVSATVASTCLISTTPVVFGTYDSVVNLSVPKDAEGAVIVTCTSGSALVVTLGEGLFPFSAAPATPLRQMGSAANRLAYFLFSTADRTTTVWGNTPASGVNAVGTGGALSLPVYGRIPAAQNKPVGGYVDTVVATVTFP